MADNVAITAGTGTTIAADDIGGVLHQRVKLSQGADGSATDVSSAAPLQVTLANTGANATSIVVDLGANNDVTVTGTVTANLAAGTNNIGDVDVLTLPALSAGTNNIGDVDVLTINGVAPAFGTGLRGATVQRVTIATDDSVPVTIASVPSHAVTNAGTFVVQENGAALTALQLIDNAVSGSGFNVSQINGVTPLMGSGATGTGSPRVTAATDSPEVTALQIMDDWDNGASDGASVSGDVAHGTADAGEPVKIGGKALSADPTAEATGDRVNALFDLIGRQVMFPYSLKENLVSGAITTAMTGTTSTSLIAAPGAGLFNYITQITVSNAHGTVGTDIAIQDGSGGTTIYTIPAAAVYGGAVVTFPAPLKQPTSNTALFCANVTTGASTKVSASGFKGS